MTDSQHANHQHDHSNHSHQDEKNTGAHNHEHGGFLGENTELFFAIGSGVFWLTGLILSFIDAIPESFSIALYIVAFILGGYFTLLEAYEYLKPNKLVEYANNLCMALNKLYESLPVLGEKDPVKRNARIVLVLLSCIILKDLLEIMGFPLIKRV